MNNTLNVHLFIYVSMPHKNKSKEQIYSKLENVKEEVNKNFNRNIIIDVIDTSSDIYRKNKLMSLAKYLELLAGADIMYITSDWETDYQCKLEHELAIKYKVPIIYER